MRADIDRQGVGIGSLTGREHGAHLVNAHAHTRRFAPFLKQRPALAIFIGQGLAIAPAAHTGTDFSHLFERIP